MPTIVMHPFLLGHSRTIFRAGGELICSGDEDSLNCREGKEAEMPFETVSCFETVSVSVAFIAHIVELLFGCIRLERQRAVLSH